MQKKIVYTTLVSFLSLALVSCGSNSKEDGGNTGSHGTAALSIVYDSSDEYNGSQGFVDHYHVHATDQNGDPISGLKVTTSIVNGVKTIAKRKLQATKGNIESSTPISFFDNYVDFSQTNVKKGDNLIIVPTVGKEDNVYLGNWTISSVDTKLTLRESAINLESAENLSYIIGGEKRYLGDNYRGRISVAHVKVLNAVTNEKGFSNFDILYDTALAAHTITLGAHTNDKKRLSTGKVDSLRAGDYSSVTVTIPISGGSGYANMPLSVHSKGGGNEPIIDLDALPTYFHLSPAKSCRIDVSKSNFHTDAYGNVSIKVDTQLDVNATAGEKSCTLTWEGKDASAFYFEY